MPGLFHCESPSSKKREHKTTLERCKGGGYRPSGSASSQDCQHATSMNVTVRELGVTSRERRSRVCSVRVLIYSNIVANVYST